MAFSLTKFVDYYFNFSVCATSRVSMFTGLVVGHHGVFGNSQAVDWVTAGGFTHALPQWLKTAGYHTAILGKLLNRVVTDTYVVPGVDDCRILVDDAWRGAAVVVTGDTTNGSTTVSNLSENLSLGDIGRTVTGTGIPGGTTIVSHTITSMVLSNAATAANVGVSLTLGGLSGHSGHGMTYTNGFIASNGTLVDLGATTGGDTWTGSDKVGVNNTASDARAAAAASGYNTDWMNRRAQTFLDGAVEPFYLELSTWAPHGDADASNKPIPASRHAAASFAATHSPSWNEADVSDKPKWLRDTVPSAMTSPQQTYADEYDIEAKRTVQAVDEMLFDLVRKLTTQGRIDRTVIILVADNGTMGGEHRLTGETANSVKNVPYEASIHNRMYIHWPSSVPAGGRANVVVIKMDDTAPHYWDAMAYLTANVGATNSALVQNIDLAPTVADIAQARMTRRPDGMSIVPVLDGRISAANFREQILVNYSALGDSSVAEMPTWAGVIKADGSKYVRYEAIGGDPAETEYYDAAAVAADELVASSAVQPALDAAITAMTVG